MAVKKNNRIEKQSKHIMSHIMLFIFILGGLVSLVNWSMSFPLSQPVGRLLFVKLKLVSLHFAYTIPCIRLVQE